MSLERLWAPWRLEYVTGSESNADSPPEPLDWQPGADHGCFLCRAAAKYDLASSADQRLMVVARGASTIVMLNRYPYNNGHLLISPQRHIGELHEMSHDEHEECMNQLARLTCLYRERLNADGFNIGLNLGKVAGAGLPGHLHWHLVPRWAGDNNFMPVLAGTRVIPQSLDALWELLSVRLAAGQAVPDNNNRVRHSLTCKTSDLAPMSALPNITIERERSLLAPYAMHSADSAGRRHDEPGHPYRGPYQRDRDRIVHSSAFRRLSQKTQVFTGEMGDYHRTRLTHTLEVSSIARTIARALRLNEDLVESLALAHDLGHPPFGHSGEDVLNECLRNNGGFNHNEQALRVCEILESTYADFPGLNLTREVLEGQRHRVNKVGHARSSESASTPNESPLLEVQAVDAADSIAYDSHDADDALELGLLEINQLLELTLWREARDRIEHHATLSERQLRRAIVKKVIDWQVSDVIDRSQQELASQRIESVPDVRRTASVVQPSADLTEKKVELEQFLFDRVYRHPGVLDKRREAQQALRQSFGALVSNPSSLPAKFRRLAKRDGLPRAVADYLAGMTDRYAFIEHKRLVGG